MVKMKKVVEVCTRVEGHGKINIYLDNQSENISRVNFEIAPFRGFETILLRKGLSDVPRIASRICGLCHNSQSIVSCKAVEDMYEIEPSERTILLRKLLMTGELIKSHCIHFFYQSMPDLLELFKLTKTTPSLYELIKFDTQLTDSINQLINAGSEIDKVFGGRAVHAITLFPGGSIYEYSRKAISVVKTSLKKALINIEWIIEKFIDLFSKFNPPEAFQLPSQCFLGLHDNGHYDRYSGQGKIINGKTKSSDFPIKEYSAHFEKDPNLRGIEFKTGKNVLVGPLARNKVVKNYAIPEVSNYLNYLEKEWNNNILFSHFLRLIEIYVEVSQALEIIDEPVLKQKESLLSLNKIKNREGIAMIEAPRGSLLHHYRVDNANSINQVKLYIATEINIPLIDEMITSYAQQLYEKNDLNSVRHSLQILVRAFDPCISCATH